MMTANYHTHTTRCGHAEGTDRSRFEAAEKAGIRTLGFSEHLPGDFCDIDFENRRYHVHRDQIAEYFETMHKFREEYKGRIDVLVGFEFGYYPEFFEQIMEQIADFPIDYLILGQHTIGPYCDRGFDDKQPDCMHQYADLVCAAVKTGCWTYVAHPDFFNYTCTDEDIAAEYERICIACRETDTPVEINMNGMDGKRHYPSRRMFDLAAKHGVKVIIGADAHDSPRLLNEALYDECIRFAKDAGVELIDTVPLRDPVRSFRAWQAQKAHK